MWYANFMGIKIPKNKLYYILKGALRSHVELICVIVFLVFVALFFPNADTKKAFRDAYFVFIVSGTFFCGILLSKVIGSSKKMLEKYNKVKGDISDSDIGNQNIKEALREFPGLARSQGYTYED